MSIKEIVRMNVVNPEPSINQELSIQTKVSTTIEISASSEKDTNEKPKSRLNYLALLGNKNNRESIQLISRQLEIPRNFESIKYFPQSFVSAINSADINKLVILCVENLQSNCEIRLTPLSDIIDVRRYLETVNAHFQTVPDGILHFIQQNYHDYDTYFIINCQFNHIGTNNYQNYIRTRHLSLLDAMDLTNTSCQKIAELLKIENYIKYHNYTLVELNNLLSMNLYVNKMNYKIFKIECKTILKSFRPFNIKYEAIEY